MELLIGINSYMSLEEADAIVDDNLLDTDSEYTTWHGLSADNKTKLLIRGARIIDSIPFRGVKYNLSDVSDLQWPRLINNKLVECPLDIKVALLKQVLRDYSNKDKQEIKLQEMGVKSYSINKASISFSDKNSSKLDNGVYSEIYYDIRRWVL